MSEEKVKTLVLDIETAPAEAYIWGLYDVTVGISQVKSSTSILCWSAKWAGDKDILFSSIHHFGKNKMIHGIYDLLNEADEVVGWNSKKFDTAHLNTEFILAGLPPPSPYKQVDLLAVVRSKMKFLSNKLDFVSRAMGIGNKVEHEGFPLWIACMAGDKAAWSRMREYNEQDVLLTEQLYDKLKPWITSGVNRSAVKHSLVCPNCGSSNLHSKGLTRTLQLQYRRFQCQDCGTWTRTVVAEHKTDRTTRLVLER